MKLSRIFSWRLLCRFFFFFPQFLTLSFWSFTKGIHFNLSGINFQEKIIQLFNLISSLHLKNRKRMCVITQKRNQGKHRWNYLIFKVNYRSFHFCYLKYLMEPNKLMFLDWTDVPHIACKPLTNGIAKEYQTLLQHTVENCIKPPLFTVH